MSTNATIPSKNLRELAAQVKGLLRRGKSKGLEVLGAETAEDVREVIGAGRKNWLLNPNGAISQRGDYTSATSMSNGTYYLDRWYSQVSVVSATIQQTTVTLPDGREVNARKINCTTGGTGYMGQTQAIEDFGAISEQTITISARVRTNHPKVGFRHAYTGDFGDKFPADGEWHFVTATTTLGDITSAGHAANKTSFGIFAYDDASVAISTNDYIEFTDVELVEGTVAGGSVKRSEAEELALCQRYYEKSYDHGTAPGTATHISYIRLIADSGNSCQGIQFATPKRSTPTVTVWDLSGTKLTGWGVNSPGETGVGYFYASGAFTKGNSYSTHFVAEAEL